MRHTNFRTGFVGYDYSKEAAAITSVLIQNDDANTYRFQLREWLDKIENPFCAQYEDVDKGQAFAEFLTDLVRVGSGLPMEGR